MAQQINLCTPILLKPKHYFSAQTMAQTLGVFVALGGLLCAAWVWNLQRATEGFLQVMGSQTNEIESLKNAIQRGRAAAAPVDAALLAQLQAARTAVQQREQLRDALQQGMLVPGWGHSDRLLWVARSIPAPVWVTDVKMDEGRFEVSGFTLEPAALNDWVSKLSTNPLMQSMKLATVKVESAVAAQMPVPATAIAASATAAAPAAGTPASPPAVQRSVWSFSLLSATPPATAPLVSADTSSGAKP